MGEYWSKPEEPSVIQHGVAKSINIMIVGKPGIGKSTLVNGLLGQDVAIVGQMGQIYTEGVTRLVTTHKVDHNGITATVYDTPGLLDSSLDQSVIVRHIQEVFSNVDLLLLCIRTADSRFINDDENNRIIKLLEDSLGKGVWRKTLVTLVFANELIGNLKTTLGNNKLAITRNFQETKKSWDDIFKRRLPGYCGVIPTGHINQGKLLEWDKYYWLTNFWEKCFLSLQDDSKKAALVQLNKSRLTKEVDVTIKGKLEETKITITDELEDILRRLFTRFTETLAWLSKK